MLYPGFNPIDFSQAQQAAVGDINEISMAVRWQEESEYFAKQVVLQITNAKVVPVLDYGCGPGRLTHEILSQSAGQDVKLHITATDQSENMLRLAQKYNQEFVDQGLVDFLTLEEFDQLPQKKYDIGLCVYVLQHVPAFDLRPTVRRLAGCVDQLLFINSLMRMAVPKFENDGVDDLAELLRHFWIYAYGVQAYDLNKNYVLRQMFQSGGIRHVAFWCYNRATYPDFE